MNRWSATKRIEFAALTLIYVATLYRMHSLHDHRTMREVHVAFSLALAIALTLVLSVVSHRGAAMELLESPLRLLAALLVGKRRGWTSDRIGATALVGWCYLTCLLMVDTSLRPTPVVILAAALALSLCGLILHGGRPEFGFLLSLLLIPPLVGILARWLPAYPGGPSVLDFLATMVHASWTHRPVPTSPWPFSGLLGLVACVIGLAGWSLAAKPGSVLRATGGLAVIICLTAILAASSTAMLLSLR